ncbi:MAG: GerMN domain-containing protein [Christensenellales bacterium]
MKEALGYESAESADRLEMLIIYSFVNTLTELPYIKKVWMSEGGEKLGHDKPDISWQRAFKKPRTHGQRIRINILKTNAKRVIVGMSGGVDPSVAALVLKQQGSRCDRRIHEKLERN